MIQGEVSLVYTKIAYTKHFQKVQRTILIKDYKVKLDYYEAYNNSFIENKCVRQTHESFKKEEPVTIRDGLKIEIN